MNKTDKIKKKLQIVMYVLIILSFLRSFIARASAESAPDWVENYFRDEISNDVLLSDYNSMNVYLTDAFLHCPYISKVTFTGTSDKAYVIIFSSHERISPAICSFSRSGGSHFIVSSNAQSYSRGVICSDSLRSASDYYAYIFTYYRGSYSFSSASVNGTTVSTSSSYGSMYFVPSSSFNRLFYHGDTYQGNIYTKTLSYMSYGILPMGTLGDSFYGFTTNNLRSALFDDRFHARTFKNSYNQNMLEIKWDSNVYPGTGSFTYLKSVLQLTVVHNGNKSVVSFDSDNYPDLFVTPNTSYIPYMFLDDVGNIITLGTSDSAFLTKIQLTQFAYPSPSDSSSATAYTASTLYNLSLTDSIQLPIWRDPTITQQGGHIIDIATGNVYDNVSFSPPDGYSQQHLSDLESVSWADVKVISQVAVTGNSQSAIDNLYKDVAFLLMQDWQHFADSSLNDFNDVAAYIQSDNQYTDTYDIIIFLWNDNGSDLCWVTYTHRYYIRLMYKQFGNFQTIMEGSAAYVADIYDYLFSRFEPLNDNLILYFDSALSNNQTILSYVQSINGFCNSIDNTLFTGFNSIVGSGGRSLTDIYNRLGDISVGGGGGLILNDFMYAFENKMTYLFVPTYDGLEDNFDTAIDDLGILALPFSFSYELISACKVPYSYTLDITFPSMSIPWHEEVEGGSVDYNMVLWEDYDLSFNPASVIPSDWLEFFQYLNALLVLVSVTLLTYRHIFRHSEGQGGNIL